MEKGILVIAGGPEITANPDSFVYERNIFYGNNIRFVGEFP